MEIELNFSPEVEAEARRQATERKMKVEDYLALLIEEDLGIRKKFGQENSTEPHKD